MSWGHRSHRLRRLSTAAIALATAAAAPGFAGCGSENASDGVQETSSALLFAATAKNTSASTVSATAPRTAVAAPPLTTVGGAVAPPYLGDANYTAAILSDADTLWATYFGDADEAGVEQLIHAQFTKEQTAPLWAFGSTTSALVQLYDTVAPLDSARAQKYLARLRSYANGFLASRDDVMQFPPDAFRNRVMPAWGAFTHNRDDQWNTDVSTSGLLTYAMAAFARRVLENPSLFADNPKRLLQYRRDAIAHVSAVLDTYEAFRPEVHLDDADPDAYFMVPAAYATLSCDNDADGCEGYRDTAGQPLAYNENLSMMKALAEAALASNTAAYRQSPDATLLRLYRSQYEAPLLIAKNVLFFERHLWTETLSDGTEYYQWNHQVPLPRLQDTAHAGFELQSIASILLDKPGLDALLAANGRTEQVPLSSSRLFVDFANTFLRKIWHYDFQNPDPNADGQNLLDKMIDGSSHPTESDNANQGCGGWIPLAQYSPWVWTRCHDATFHNNLGRGVSNEAALLRYRQYD